jgi:hypothetical protein
MFIRLATEKDYSYIAHALASKGINYIKPSHAKTDIAAGRLYVVEDEGRILAQCALVEEKEHGYTAMKRMIIYRKENNGRGISSMFIQFFSMFNCPIGATPWTENERMKHILRKHGFVYQYTFAENYMFFLKTP